MEVVDYYRNYPLELTKFLNEYIKLVPNEFHRKFYVRIFKWTIAFGIWNKPNPHIEAIKLKLADDEDESDDEEMIDDHSVSGSQQGFRVRQLRFPSLLCFVYALTIYI